MWILSSATNSGAGCGGAGGREERSPREGTEEEREEGCYFTRGGGEGTSAFCDGMRLNGCRQ